MVSSEQNLELCISPTREEVKAAVFALSGDSTSGPDSFTSIFFQVCWDIVGEDIHNMLKLVYIGCSLPKSITHTNLVLLPKRPMVQTFSELITICLSNFISKVISRVVHDRLEKILPTFISSNQSGFVKGRKNIIEVLSKYEHTSGQMINKAKSSFYMHYNVVGTLLNSMGAITGFTRGEFLLTYLGYQIFYTRRRKDYYNDLIKKVKAELHSWKGKLLSYGGKATLISSVLQSMPTHILYVLDPPDNVLEHLHKTFARFFRNNKEEGRSRHWTKWQNLCLPKEEGGVGFRSLFDVSKALFSKLWWMFRTSKSLWSNFMWNKYYFPINEELHEVADLRADDGWNEKLLEQSFPRDIADPIRLEAKFDNTNE
ncbi:uncharacterized protein [Nicotiana tomentosiformis]|uniref:uncharacterized protein n=1 Tax=Nicotiana tomentosiformis TaxID=4098 RepID=UPI00388C53F4